jgi:hypothetical protein
MNTARTIKSVMKSGPKNDRVDDQLSFGCIAFSGPAFDIRSHFFRKIDFNLKFIIQATAKATKQGETMENAEREKGEPKAQTV